MQERWGRKNRRKTTPTLAFLWKKEKEKKNRNHPILLEAKKNQQNISSPYTVALHFGKTQKKHTSIPISPLHCE